jgi:hypothetical protein
MYPSFSISTGSKPRCVTLAIFGKREKSDLTPAERRQVAALVKELKKEEEKP